MNKQGEHGIGWCDYTWNPITGCLNHTNGLCKGGGFPCYAYKLAHGRLKKRYLANPSTISKCKGEVSVEEYERQRTDPFFPRIWPERLKPLKGYPEGTKIFLNDMSEWMGPWIPDEWKRQVLEFIKAHPQYIFQTLTKQPQSLIKFMGGSPVRPYRKARKLPDNCWAGVTITSKDDAPMARDFLLERMSKVNFLSIEPLLGYMDGWALGNVLPLANWLIIGLQTPYSPKTAPKIEHVQEIVEAADKARVPMFLKDNLKPLLCTSINGKDVIESHNLWAFKYFKLRQDFPRCMKH